MPAEILSLQVNGDVRHVPASGNRTLLQVLREDLGLTGTKHGCDQGECGACTVLIGGNPVLACITLASLIGDRPVITVEGLSVGGRPDRLQSAFAELGAAQCGYCTPGMLMSATALLEMTPSPEVDEIKNALSGNLCRCTGYNAIIGAVALAASRGVGK